MKRHSFLYSAAFFGFITSGLGSSLTVSNNQGLLTNSIVTSDGGFVSGGIIRVGVFQTYTDVTLQSVASVQAVIDDFLVFDNAVGTVGPMAGVPFVHGMAFAESAGTLDLSMPNLFSGKAIYSVITNAAGTEVGVFKHATSFPATEPALLSLTITSSVSSGSAIVGRFDLHSGDSTPTFGGAESNQFFSLAPVPEPSMGLLAFLGTSVLLRRGRR